MTSIASRTLSSCAVGALVLGLNASALAENAWWAYGQVEFVQQSHDLVAIGLTSTALDGCLHDRVYFRDPVLGEKLVDRAFSMALSAQASGRQLGIVIDLDARNQGAECRALGNMVLID